MVVSIPRLPFPQREFFWTTVELAFAIILGMVLLSAIAGPFMESEARWRTMTEPSRDKRPAALYVAYRLYLLELSRDDATSKDPREALRPYFSNADLRERLGMSGSPMDDVDALYSEYDLLPSAFTDPTSVTPDQIIFAEKSVVSAEGSRFVVLGEGRILKMQTNASLIGEKVSDQVAAASLLKTPQEQ